MQNNNGNMPYNAIGRVLKKRFGGRVVKLSLDGGFTCPNRDGTKGTGGCSFCSPHGSGELSSDIPHQMDLLSAKWPECAGYIAYFQSHTNTYGDIGTLKSLYLDALSHPKVVGLAIATRPDCLPPDVLDLLEEINRQTFLWVELGLQTIHDKTAVEFNRGYPLLVYDQAVSQLQQRNIRVVTHLILGLPGETQENMMESVKYVTGGGKDLIYGVKLHLLNVVKGSTLSKTNPDYVPFASLDEYVDLVCSLLPIIPWDVTIHRLTGDVPRRLLISPEWSYQKRTILNSINQRMLERNLKQGCGL